MVGSRLDIPPRPIRKKWWDIELDCPARYFNYTRACPFCKDDYGVL